MPRARSRSWEARLDVQMSDLHSSDFPKLEPATFDLVAELQNNQLAFNGKLQQAKIQPVADYREPSLRRFENYRGKKVR